MVFDRLENVGLYFGLSKRIEDALKFLETGRVSELSVGKHDIAEGVFALVSEYVTKLVEECLWETHRKYIDIQLLLSGCEYIGYANLGTLTETAVYDEDKDCAFYSGEGTDFRLEPGSFALFYPEDAHRPGVLCGNVGPVRKVVLKVLAD